MGAFPGFLFRCRAILSTIRLLARIPCFILRSVHGYCGVWLDPVRSPASRVFAAPRATRPRPWICLWQAVLYLDAGVPVMNQALGSTQGTRTERKNPTYTTKQVGIGRCGQGFCLLVADRVRRGCVIQSHVGRFGLHDSSDVAHRQPLGPARTFSSIAPPVSRSTVAATGYAILRAGWKLEVIRTRAPIARLPAQFSGFRIVQLSDIHISPFMEAWQDSWIRRSSELASAQHDRCLPAISFAGDPTVVGEVVGALSGLRAPFGVFACLGNHESLGLARRTRFLVV
jgi:hypothetical protein